MLTGSSHHFELKHIWYSQRLTLFEFPSYHDQEWVPNSEPRVPNWVLRCYDLHAASNSQDSFTRVQTWIGSNATTNVLSATSPIYESNVSSLGLDATPVTFTSYNGTESYWVLASSTVHRSISNDASLECHEIKQTTFRVSLHASY